MSSDDQKPAASHCCSHGGSVVMGTVFTAQGENRKDGKVQKRRSRRTRYNPGLFLTITDSAH